MLLSLVFFLCSGIIALEPYAGYGVDESIQRYFDTIESVWHDNTKYTVTYNATGWPEEKIFYSYNSLYTDPWLPMQKNTYTYGARGLEEEIVYLYQYDFFNEVWEWVENTKTVYSYNDGGRISEKTLYLWNPMYGWQKNEKYAYSYDTGGAVVEIVYYDSYNGADETWNKSTKKVFSYDTENRLSEEIWYNYFAVSDGASGSADNLILFQDKNGDGDWDTGEDIWYDSGAVTGEYDGSDLQVYDNSDGWNAVSYTHLTLPTN